MTEESIVAEGGLTEWQRVGNTFVAPSATFTDIRRNASWWLPFVISVLISLAFAFTVDRKVGFDQVAETQVHLSPSSEERMAALTPEDRADQMQKSTAFSRYFTYGFPLVNLAIAALASLVLWATFNFGLGATTTYGQIFCLWMFANLPRLFTALVTIITLNFGSSAETFNIQQPTGTNLAYYLPDIPAWLRAFLGFGDIISFWVLFLLIFGGAIVAKVKVGAAAAAILGWWLLLILVGTVATAAFS